MAATPSMVDRMSWIGSQSNARCQTWRSSVDYAQPETLRAEIATLDIEADRLAAEITALTESSDILIN
jgi:hypothetical protein